MSSKRGALGGAFLTPGALWLAIFFLIPIGLVAALSFGSTDVVGRPIYGWHPENYESVFQSSYIQVLWRTVLYAGATTIGCLVLGYTAAYTIGTYGGRYRNALILLIVLPGFVDYLIRVFAIQQLMVGDGLAGTLLAPFGVEKSQGLIGTPTAVVAGLIYNYLVFMILPIYAVVERLDGRLIQAARDLGATSSAAFLRVTLPLTMPGVAAGCLLVFLASMGDFATPQLLGDANTYMLGNLIQSQFLEGGGATRPTGAGLVMVLMITLGVALALYSLAARGRVKDPAP